MPAPTSGPAAATAEGTVPPQCLQVLLLLLLRMVALECQTSGLLLIWVAT